MCVVENSGRFGGTYAAPITTLMIEKYLNDTIAASRMALVESKTNANLIPPLMLQKMRAKDSLQRAREEEKNLKNDLNKIKDTLQSEDNPTEAELKTDRKKGDRQPADTPVKKALKMDMVIPERQKEPVITKKDSAA
jgi:penicillin-binding protein 2